MNNRKISMDEDTSRPLPVQIPERRRTVSLGGLRHFYESIGGGGGNANTAAAVVGGGGGTNQYPAFGMLRDMSGSSPLTSYSASNSMPNQPTSYFNGHSPVSDTLPSPTGVGLSGLLRRASWIEGAGTNTDIARIGGLTPYGTQGRNNNQHHTSGNNSGQHLFNSLPNRMRRPGVLRQSSDVPATRAPPIHPDNDHSSSGNGNAIMHNTKVENTTGPPDTVAGGGGGGHPFVKARSESALKSISAKGFTPAHVGANGQQAHPRTNSGPERPATPMSNMILSGQMLD
ncbi:hypothetical protein BDF22DRAFT_684040 [Syncephalis plumigaleata]|nr:hypothetical protein BDF22DRAFT_684040 [Syncephalis plumigaleata]